MNESLASVNHKQIGYRIKEVREQNQFFTGTACRGNGTLHLLHKPY